MNPASQCLIVEQDQLLNAQLQENMRTLGLSPLKCEGLFNCTACSHDPHVVIMGKGADIPMSHDIGNVEVMIRETCVPVLLPADLPQESRMRFHNYHLYDDLTRMGHLIREVVKRHQRRLEIKQEHENIAKAITLMDEGEISFKTLAQAQALAALFGTMAQKADKRIGLGLCELFINAIEHGNLALTSQEKRRFRKEGRWLQEVEKRQNLEAFKNRSVKVHLMRKNMMMHLSILDEGAGFDWQGAHSDQPDARESGALGLKLVQNAGFEDFYFAGTGNEVHCSFRL